jgi:hypothetical protein
MLTAFFQDRFDTVFFPEALPASHEPDLNRAFGGDPFPVFAQGLA